MHLEKSPMADELDFVDIGPIGTEEPETTLLEERRQALDALNDIMGSSEQCPRKEKRGAQHAPLSAAADAFGTSEQSFNNELSQLLFQDIHSTVSVTGPLDSGIAFLKLTIRFTVVY